MPLELGTFGAWFNPVYADATRIRFVVEAEALGYRTAWLGMGGRAMPDLTFAERALDATFIIVATAIINLWTNDAATIARSYHRIAVKHPDRFLLGIGIGHPESISKYRNPMEILARYLDVLDVEGVAAVSPTRFGESPYLVVPEHTRHAREILGDGPLLAPEHKAVVSTDVQHARVIGRGFLRDPYFRLSNYTNNLLRYGFTKEDFVEGGSDRAVDALVLHGTPESIKAGLAAHVSAGASHVSVQVLTEPGKDPMPGYRSLARVLF